jgi:hypothetical protein
VAGDESAIGSVGVIIIATRGQKGAGEVRIKIRGGSEVFLAWSPEPLPKGTTVLVTDYRGPRTVNVLEWDDSLGEAPQLPGSTSSFSGE